MEAHADSSHSALVAFHYGAVGTASAFVHPLRITLDDLQWDNIQ